MRSYLIEDEGDEFHLALLADGAQVGGAIFPDDGSGAGFELAREVGESFASHGGMGAERPI